MTDKAKSFKAGSRTVAFSKAAAQAVNLQKAFAPYGIVFTGENGTPENEM